MLEGRQDGPVGIVQAGQFQYALLHSPQLSVTALHQADAALIARQRFLEAELAVLQLADGALQLLQGLFKGQSVGSGVVHGSIPSTRLNTLPRCSSVTSRSPTRTSSAARTTG